HEGLGSLSMWKDFPQQLCASGGFHGLIYSRPGYGQSTPRADDEHWQPDFMHRQAYEVLPALLAVLKVDTQQHAVWLFGHSDGGSIALLAANQNCQNKEKKPSTLTNQSGEHPSFGQTFRISNGAQEGQGGLFTGIIALAPHIMVEDLSIQNIRQARKVYLETNLKQKLARYHTDPDSAFWGWNNAWLSKEFRSWSIEEEISSISCPVLAVQGLNDEYGTLEQIRGIKRRVPQTELLELKHCGHSPHRDQPERLIETVVEFIQHNTP
ncbi:MAG: alpha/beta fold hydrolase, partial [Thiolinea sp.]